MHTSKMLIAPTLAIAVLAGAAPAFAADPTPTATATPPVATAPPAQPEEGDLIEADPTDSGSEAPAPTGPTPSSGLSPVPQSSACEPHWKYTPTSKDKDYHKGVGAEQANYNNTSRTAKSSFTSEVSGTVGIAHTGELKVGGSVAVVEIEGKFSVNVSVSLTAKIGNTISVDTPPRKSTLARYGVYRLKSYGYSQYTYQNCTKGVKKNVTIYTPRRVGWYLWEE